MLEALPGGENDLAAVANRLVASVRGRNERLLGFGPALHRVDPRVAPLVEIAEQLGLVTRWVSFAREVERVLQEQSRRPLPINVDGIIAALMLEMGLDWRLGKALFLVSRAAGLSAHYFEQITTEKPFKAVPHGEIEYQGPPSRGLPGKPGSSEP